MRKLTILQRIKQAIAAMGWSLFIWGNNTTEDEYWHSIYLQEKPCANEEED